MDFDAHNRRTAVPSFIPDSVRENRPDAGNRIAPLEDMAPPRSTGDVSEPPQVAPSSLLPDLSPYDLTVGEALVLFTQQNRKRPSDRTLQRYCQDGRFECYKLKTTRNGTPVHEWIINSTSLLAFIRTKPVLDDSEQLVTPAFGGDAIEITQNTEQQGVAPFDTASPDSVGDAESVPVLPRSDGQLPDVKATPEEGDDANVPVVNRVALLIENAKLTAKLDAQNDLIGELREDKSFMREQITHQRKNDSLMADMHRETLHTLKAVSVAGRHTRIEMPNTEHARQNESTFYDTTDSEQRPDNDATGGV